jgi:hypothetical protein
MNKLILEDDVMQNQKTREFKEIIKNHKCTFSSEDSDKQIYYFCRCSKNTYAPICKSCAETCHKEHKEKFSIEGFFECSCGLHNHNITEKNEIRYKNSLEIIPKCFYSEFYSRCFNKGFYKTYEEKNLCAICFFNPECNKEKIKPDVDIDIYYYPNYFGNCQCENHNELNVVTLSNELNKNFNFKDYMLNFNFNIINICPMLKKIFIDFMNEKLDKLIKYKK